MNLNIKKQSGIYTLTSEQILPISLETAWEFFSTPKNLDKITPAEMNFNITNDPPDKTYPGQIITYKIGILPGIKSNWVTEITQLKEKEFFVDEQRFGPYAMWHHEHHFEKISESETLMRDLLNFKMPLGAFGDLVAGKLVLNKVKFIFESRFKILEDYFSRK
ncbi:SRPBCC family protein [Halpernia frigidisoli]|uniref:Ligand-binding SRPBCC domain-containing protein n=1 Tax=Halpernia frigidisoli TaxID=1125876 RepID=A0A1I3DPC2_9FLAO|nr:SRPBCC family protein [Halpernia frigidisoli]SFH88513.1 Ligand-binding SRPBCC domain-containing protein [Halpernia frigidisoli]